MKKFFVILVALFVVGFPAPVSADTCIDDLLNLNTGICVAGGPQLPPLPIIGPSPTPHNPPPTGGGHHGGGSGHGGNTGGSTSHSASKPTPRLTPAQRHAIAVKKAKAKRAEKARAANRTHDNTQTSPVYKPAVGKTTSNGILFGYFAVIALGVISTYILLFYPRHRRS